MNIDRRKILISLGSLSILGLIGYRKFKSSLQPSSYPGVIQGANFSRGHTIRDPKYPKSTSELSVDTLIVGAGVSGLSCAYHLNQNKIKDFLIVDLEDRPGGNARGGTNRSGSYPQAAHYLPIPTDESKELKKFLLEIGVITQLKSNGEATYNPYYLCSDPAERLFLNGRWQLGLEPNMGLSDLEKQQMERFYNLMDKYKHAVGSDGKKAFAIPLSESSKDSQFIDLDQMTMKDFMEREGFTNKYLLWYVNYCCKDDYGVGLAEVSAWAGVHYFASRDGVGADLQPGKSNLLTWPEGNQFLSDRLFHPIQDKVKLNFLIFEIKKEGQEYITRGFDFVSKKTMTIKSRKIVYASPEFTANKVVKVKSITDKLNLKTYSPWMVANILLKKRPKDEAVPLCWDNVSYYSESLGHVVSDHQSLASRKIETTLTQYWPLKKVNESIKKARIRALTTTHSEWCEMVTRELENLYPGIKQDIERIDISLFGHGMIVPEKGFLARRTIVKDEKFYFCHTDQAGVSIFEEAFYQGIQACQEVLSAN